MTTASVEDNLKLLRVWTADRDLPIVGTFVMHDAIFGMQGDLLPLQFDRKWALRFRIFCRVRADAPLASCQQKKRQQRSHSVASKRQRKNPTAVALVPSPKAWPPNGQYSTSESCQDLLFDQH